MAEIHELSGRAIADEVRAGRVSPGEVLAHTLERAERLGPAVGAFVRLTPQLARHQGEEVAVDAAARPLAGVPIPIKDLTAVAGVETGHGSAAVAASVPREDAGVVRRLRRAGAVVVGKTTTPEFGLSAYTEPVGAAPARTPWDLTRSAGGSSGGAAAAVAAGIVPIAHGSDGGGSLRIPAAACGIVGLKPSRGRVSAGPTRVDGPGLSTDGVLTRDVRDTALALDVLARGWPGDDRCLPTPPRGYLAVCDRPPQALRVGLLTTPILTDSPVHPQAEAAAGHTAALLEGLGHTVAPAPVPFDAGDWSPFLDVLSVIAASIPVPPGTENRLLPMTAWLRARGHRLTAVEYAAAIARGQTLQRVTAAAWHGLDVVLTPTLAAPPPPVGAPPADDPEDEFWAQTRFTPWASVCNVLGAPAISLPLHRAPAEPGGPVLPWGTMLIARTGREDLLLGLAAALEAAAPWPAPPPPGAPGPGP